MRSPWWIMIYPTGNNMAIYYSWELMLYLKSEKKP